MLFIVIVNDVVPSRQQILAQFCKIKALFALARHHNASAEAGLNNTLRPRTSDHVVHFERLFRFGLGLGAPEQRGKDEAVFNG